MSSREAAYEYPDTHDDGGGWLLSYADLITLLTVFFVVLLSMSSVQLNRFDLLRSTFTPESPHDSLTSLKSDLDSYIEQSELTYTVETALDRDGLSVRFTNAVLFDSGVAAVRADGREVLKKVTSLLSRIDSRYQVVIEGYTDDVPIHTAEFRSNWELSAERAIRVLEELVRAGIDQQRLSIQGFADTRPLAPPAGAEELEPAPSLDEWRSQNRRVVLRVF